MKHIKKLSLVVLFSLSCTVAFAQFTSPVSWSYRADRISKTEAMLSIKATINEGWHIYSQYGKVDAPIKTRFVFTPSKAYTLVGKTMEPTPISKYEKVFGTNVNYFQGSVIFRQKIVLKTGTTAVKGTVEFTTCDEKSCLPADQVAFSIPVTSLSPLGL